MAKIFRPRLSIPPIPNVLLDAYSWQVWSFLIATATIANARGTRCQKCKWRVIERTRNGWTAVATGSHRAHTWITVGLLLLVWVLCFGESQRVAAQSMPACQEPIKLSLPLIPFVRSKAMAGDRGAACLLGIAYHHGFGVDKSDLQSAKWLLKAAEAGIALAQNQLGYLYEHGNGVPQSDSDAAKWYRAGASQGLAVAQNNLGYMFFTGRGVEAQSFQEAVNWFRKAAEQGLPTAQVNIGNMYQTGKGVSREYAQAVQWYQKAADQGDPTAATKLGLMYLHGEGVARDFTRAVDFFQRGASRGDLSA